MKKTFLYSVMLCVPLSTMAAETVVSTGQQVNFPDLKKSYLKQVKLDLMSVWIKINFDIF